MSIYEVTTASTTDHISGIHSLQKKNLKRSLTLEDIRSQGFVTCDHSVELLTRMNEPYSHVISLHNGEVVGYALVMLKTYKNDINILKSMFDQIDELSYHDQNVKDSKYFVMGQVCIDKDHRSQGLFDKMYQYMKSAMSDYFDYCITEIATENLRSRNAHKRVGFSDLHQYTDPKSQISWELVLWDWT